MMKTPARWLIVLLLAVHFPVLSWAKTAWTRTTLGEVHILTDGSPKAAADWAVRLTVYRQALAQWVALADRPLPPMTVMLFRDDADLYGLMGVKRSGGRLPLALYEVEGMMLIAIAEGGDKSAMLAQIINHDVRWVVRRTGTWLPLWLETGATLALSGFKYGKGQGRLEPSGKTDQWLAAGAFFKVERDTVESTADSYRAQAAAYVHLLWSVEGGARENFGKAAAAWVSGQARAPNAGAEAVLGPDPGQWAGRFEQQVKLKRGPTISVDEKELSGRMESGPVEGLEILVRMVDILAAYGKKDEADRFLDQAVEYAPQLILVQEAQARRELRRDNQTEAARLYRETLMAGGTGNANAWLISATEYLDQARSLGADVAGSGGKGVDTALTEIRLALELDAGNPQVWLQLGRAYFVSQQIREEGVADLSQLVTDHPTGLLVRYYRGLLYSRLNRGTEAMADVDYVIGHSQTPRNIQNKAVAFRVQVQFSIDKAVVEQLAREKKFPEARALANQGQSQAAGTATERDYADLIDWVEENEQWSRIVDLSKQKDWPELAAAARKFLQEYPRSTVAKEARLILVSAEKRAQRAETDGK